MIWSILIIGSVSSLPTTYGEFPTKELCQISAKEWQMQGIKAGCIPRQSPEEALKSAQGILDSFIKR
tara:strand:- start:1795 stop:1995 length:201 start_codon:yes stop_codon:yes gene_type:complete